MKYDPFEHTKKRLQNAFDKLDEIPIGNPLNTMHIIPEEDDGEYTGLSSNYYKVDITNPTSEDNEPYTAECNDIIEALGMTYAEGNVFKAVWRRCAARTLGKEKKGNNSKYDAEKMVFFSNRVLEIDKNR